MTTETLHQPQTPPQSENDASPETQPPETQPPEKVTYAFLGIYIKKSLKDKVYEEAKRDQRSMSSLCSRIFTKHFFGE